jgi:peptidoglycan-N-acetylglucosamine deacetylase
MTRLKIVFVTFAALFAFCHANICASQTQVSPAPLPSGSADNLRIAITCDDLPAHGSLPPGETRMGVASKTIAALHEAGVPPTYGFTNGALVEQQPADAAVLQAWRDAGNVLGNHSWSHLNLNQHSLEEFQADVERNEPLLKKSMSDGKWHWFRFPYLAQGDTPEKQAGIRGFLRQHGYKVAGTTMSFADYLYNEPYARCSAKADTKALALLESTYLAAADESITYYRNLSRTLYGRDVPYVLLMHIGAFDAKMLPRLLDLYRSRGFKFVTLEEAEADDFYKQDTDLRLAPGPDNLEGAMWQRGLNPPQHAVPQPQLDSLCR